MVEFENILSAKANDLLLSIAKCENFVNSPNTRCLKIVTSKSNHERFLPIPWQGHIEMAKILFVSSNPSVLKNQIKGDTSFGPDSSWLQQNDHDERIVDFYEYRFSKPRQGKPSYTRNSIYYLCNSFGEARFSSTWVRYWASVRKRAAEMLGEDRLEVIAGEYYAITEIVHCQSNDEDGVFNAKDICSDKYLESIFEIAVKAKVIALLGTHSREVFNEKYGLDLKEYGTLETRMPGGERLILALPHPNSRGTRKQLNQQEIDKIHNYLGKFGAFGN